MRNQILSFLVFVILPLPCVPAQNTVPTFRQTVGQDSYILVGRDPAQGGTTTIPTILVPIILSFEAKKVAGRPFVMDATSDVRRLLRSPVFSPFAFPPGGTTQYGDALLRTIFPQADNWHTLLGPPEVKPIQIRVPVGSGYILTSKKTGGSLAVLDVEFLQRELFRQIPFQQGKFVIALTHNTTYYALGDATVCCSWGTHGIDSVTGNSFVLGSYLQAAPAVVIDKDVQPITQQLAEFLQDPQYDPLVHDRNVVSGNTVPAWLRPVSLHSGDPGSCAGHGVASTYFLLEPTDTNPKNNAPSSKAFLAPIHGLTYHLQNIALLPWYLGTVEGLGRTYSFPDARALTTPSHPCPARGRRAGEVGPVSPAPQPTVAAIPRSGSPNGHQLIGYWAGYGAAGSMFPLREVSPQWDIVIVAFATPDPKAPEGTMQFHTPAGLDPAQFKADIADLKNHGRKVLISLGGGGQHFTLADPGRVPNYLSSVARIVTEYGFDGIDIDFESPSLSIEPGDTDFRHPTTPSLVNLISALRQLHDRFGPRFLISLVPEGTQIWSEPPA